MPKGLLKRLGLTRKNKTPNQPQPVVVQQPVVQQPQRPVVPPVVQQQPQQQPPQQPPQQAWQAPDTTNRRVQAGPLNKPALAKQAVFEKSLANAMPAIRQAKQLALTVDGQRIEASKTDPQSKLTVGLTGLAGKLTPQIKVIDQHSSIVRQKAEALDFDTAESELAKALVVATNMLDLEEDFHRILLECGKAPPKELAGQGSRSPEQKQYEQELKDAQPSLDYALSINSSNDAVKLEQQSVRKLLADSRGKAEKGEYNDASKLLADAVGDCSIIDTLAKAHETYQERKSSHSRLIAVVQSIDPKSNEGQARASALKLLADSEAAAHKGVFTNANSLLDQFEQAATALVPHDDIDARMYPESLATVDAHVKQALAIEVPSQTVIDMKKLLPKLLADSQAAADQRNFKVAYEQLENASILANRVLQLQRSWDSYAQLEDDTKPLLDTVKKLRLTDQKQSTEQKAILADSERATKDAMAGKLNEASALLQSAFDRGSALLSAATSPNALQYFKEWAEVRPEVEEAEAVTLTSKPIVDAKRDLADGRAEVDKSVASNDYDGAVFGLSVVSTRALLVLRLAEQTEEYERAEKSFKKQFDLAQAASPNLPGVAPLLQQLTRDLMAARGASANDPVTGKRLLYTALRSANQIVAITQKVQDQRDRSKDLGDVLGQVKKSYLPPGSTDNLNQDGALNDGREFDALLVAMKVAETDKTIPKLDLMDQAARAWLAIYDGMRNDQKEDPTVKRRKQVCDTALKQAKHLRMSAQFDALGNPPWPQEKEDKAADLYVTMMLETGDLPLDTAAGGITGAKWIKSMDFEEGKGKRQFIFKRTDVPPEAMVGFPENGEAPREVLGHEIGKQLQAMTGLNFNAPETRIVSIDGGKLPDGRAGTPVAGSAQAAAPTLGSVKEVFKDHPDIVKKIPAKEMQKMAMFDMISLNMDRHQDNFLITPESGDQPPQMVPIDNGLALPDREGFNARRGKYAGGKALEWFPQSFEKFDDEMLAAIDAIDPDEIIAGMKARLDSMDRENPQLDVKGKVKQESFDMVKNSVEFMKAASKELSPVFMMDALMTEGEDLLFGTPPERAAKAKEVVEKAKRSQEAYAPLVNMTWDQKRPYYNVLYELGWRLDAMDPTWSFNVAEWDGWGRKNAEKLVTIHDRKTPCPTTVRENNAMLAEIKRLDPNTTIDAKLAGKTVRKQNSLLYDEQKKARESQEMLAAFADINARFNDNLAFDQMNDTQRFKTLERYRDFVEWGGTRMTEINGHQFKQNEFLAVYNALEQDLGPRSEHNKKVRLTALPEFTRLNDLAVKYCSEPLDVKDMKAKDLAGRLERFREFEKLGGMKALNDLGVDTEAFDTSVKLQLIILKGPAALGEVA